MKTKTAFKSLDKRAYLILLSALLLVGVLVASGFLLSSPARVVRGYFESFSAGDYETAYAYLSAPDSPLINKEAFGEYMRQEMAGNMDVANYVLERTAFRRLMQTYEVTYILQGESAEDDLRVELVRQRKKQLLVFNRYKVGVGGMVDRGYTIYAPEDIELSVDGIGIPASQSAASPYAHMSAYALPAIFRGRHQLTASGEWFDEITCEFFVLDGKEKSMNMYPLEISEDTRAYLAENAYNVFTALVAGAIQGEKLLDIPGINAIMTTNAEAFGAIKEAYRGLSDHVRNQYDGTGLKSISFKGSRDESESVFLNYGQYVCDVAFTYTYAMQELDYATGKLTEEAFNNEREGTVRFAFAHEDGGWRIVALEEYGLYY